MDMMHEIALKLQADCNSKALADVVYAMAQLGWADPRLHTLVAEYAMDNIQVGGWGVGGLLGCRGHRHHGKGCVDAGRQVAVTRIVGNGRAAMQQCQNGGRRAASRACCRYSS